MIFNTRYRISYRLCWRVLLTWIAILLAAPACAENHAPAILVYHRFGLDVADSMTTRTAVFQAQLTQLRQEGYVIMPLTTLVAGLEGKEVLPPKALAITVDDGHHSVYTELLPIIRRERLPVALFIYPSAISNADYAMTWEELTEIVASGLVEVHSHTYWHPDFHIERRRLAPDEYHQFISNQLVKSRRTLKSRLGVDAPYLAWPYGIHDKELEIAAAAADYRAAFALGERHVTGSDSLFSLPRYLITDAYGVTGLMKLLREGERRTTGVIP